MTVRDVYIFQDLDQAASDVDCDDPEAEILGDVRYARRVRRARLITERAVRRGGRKRRAAGVAELDAEDEASVLVGVVLLAMRRRSFLSL